MGKEVPPAELVDVISDEYAGAILTAVSEDSLTVNEITEKLDMSSATAYRRIEKLLDCDLVAEKTELDGSGNQYHVYESNFQSIRFEITDGRAYVHILRNDEHEFVDICNFR